jgi:hypothetical protein
VVEAGDGTRVTLGAAPSPEASMLADAAEACRPIGKPRVDAAALGGQQGSSGGRAAVARGQRR